MHGNHAPALGPLLIPEIHLHGSHVGFDAAPLQVDIHISNAADDSPGRGDPLSDEHEEVCRMYQEARLEYLFMYPFM
jgi:hypothetical protein